MKKHLKLLILLLSVALIVGALAVVAGASDAEQYDKVALYYGDELQTSDLNFDSAVAAIRNNPTASDSYTIKLLGTAEVYNGLQLGEEFTAATTVNVDLNGWQLNCENINVAVAVASSNVTVNVTGDGSVKFGSKLAYANGGAINFNNSGFGMKISSESNTRDLITSESGAVVTVKNVDMLVAYTVDVDSSDNAGIDGTLVGVGPNGKVVFENSTVKYDIAYVMDGSGTYGNYGISNTYFVHLSGEGSQAVLKNTRVETASSGVRLKDSTGAAYSEIGEGNYSFVMIDSHLECANRNEETLEYIKARKAGNTDAMITTFVKFITQENGHVYLKNSYGSATYRTLSGFWTKTAADNKNYITFDNSTYKQDYSLAAQVAGYSYGNNGEGMLDGGFTYITFKNNSKLHLYNASTIKAGGGNASKGTGNAGLGEALWKYNDGEKDVFAITLEEGARSNIGNLSFANVSALAFDPLSDIDYVYAVSSTAGKNVVHAVSTPHTVGVRPMFNVYNGINYAGRNNVVKLQAYTKADVIALGWAKTENEDGSVTYNKVTNDNNSKQGLTFYPDGTISLSREAQSQQSNAPLYWSSTYQGVTASKQHEGKVAVVTFDFLTTEHTLPFSFAISHKNVNGKTALHQASAVQLKADGTATKASNSSKEPVVVPGQWHTYTIVYQLDAAATQTKAFVFLDGEEIGGWAAGVPAIAEFRMYINANTVMDGDASLYFSGGARYLLSEYAYGETFNAADYLPESNYQDVVATVGNSQFTNVNDALEYAAAVDGYVNLLADVENEELTCAGRVKTNGYTFTYDTFMDVETTADGVIFYMTDAVTNSWYLGTAEDPAADTDKFVSRPVNRGEAIILPSNAVVANVKGENVLFTHKGWATTYVRPVGMTKAEYDAAVAELTVITDFSTVMADMPTTYYPVYDCYATVDYTWYVGSAEDPAADTAKMITNTFIVGNAIAIPSNATVQNLTVGKTSYSLKGWATTYVRPSYEEAADYLAAIQGIEVVTDFTAMTAETGATFYPVYEVASAAFSVIDANGVETFYGPNDDINKALAKGLNGATLKLYADCTITKAYASGPDGDTSNPSGANDIYFRNTKYVDLNGHTLSISCGTWAKVLDGKLYVYSSQPGGKLVDTRPENKNESEGFCQVFGHGALFQIGAYNSYPGSNVTVEAKRLAVVNNSAPRANASPAGVVIDGAVVINTGASKHNGMIWLTHTNKAVQGITIRNATVINAVAGSTLVQIPYKGSALFENCDFINIAGGCSVLGNSCSAESEIKFNNCRIGATVGTSNGTVNVDSNCVFAGLPTGATTAEGYVVAYDNYSMDMPAVLGTSYSFSYLNFATQEVINVTITEDMMPDINYVITTADNTTTYNWTYGGETVYSVVAVTYTDLSGLYAQATAACEPNELSVIKLVADGEWVLDDETATLTCGTKVGGIKSGLGKVTVTMHEGFGVKFYIEAATYAYLDAESQAKFTAVTKDEMELYVMVVGDVDVNEAFTNLTFSVKFTEEEYEYVANYRVNLADYIGASLNLLPAEDNSKAMAYYIAAYLNNAYAYFAENDADKEKLAALAAMVEANKDLYNAEAVARPTVGEAIDANDAIEIAVDLTSTPAFVINSTIGGTVNFNGEDYTIVAGEELRLTAIVLDFDNTLEIALEDGTEGTYCLGNYAANIAAAESIEGLDEAGLASLKALVAAFYDYVIYAENFR